MLNASVAKELVLTRVFNAPRELVFKAWTDPESAKHWWGPTHHPAIFIEMDVRVGGRWHGMLRSEADGTILTHRGEFLEIDPPKTLSFTFAWDEEGERGIQNVVTLTFEDLSGKTKMTLRQSPFQSTGEQEGHGEGWSSTFDRLEFHLSQH
jgi:uncharacterized protein YndB with AHSA1/START domain